MDTKEQISELQRGTVDIHSEKELAERLEEGRPLVIKAGFDPTRRDLHLGHTVLMNRLRRFQDFGHKVVFIVGDFTAQIGDPSGRSTTRPVQSAEEIRAAAQSYAEQALRVLDAERTEIKYNSEWLSPIRFDEVIRLAGRYNLARMMERDDFKKRWREHAPISIHELLYPLVQGYDSVELNNDVELGGTDQLFNLLVGRQLMREYGKRPQIVMTTPLLEGLNAREVDGEIVGDKMSKSLDNYVGIAEPASEQFGKLMSISDALMWRYYDLLSWEPTADTERRRKACAEGDNPRGHKIDLGLELVTRFHGAEDAKRAREQWEAQFSRREVPTDMPEVSVEAEDGAIWLPKALVAAGLTKSSSDARRRVSQGAVQVDGEKVSDVQATLKSGATYVVKAGKRAWARITVSG